MDARTIDNIEIADPFAKTRTKIPHKRTACYRRTITTSDTEAGTKRTPTITDTTTITLDSGPILGSRPPTTTKTGTAGTINTTELHPNGEWGNRVGNRPGSYGTRSTVDELSEVCGRQKRPIQKMGHAPRINPEEQNNWDLGNAVREIKKNFSSDLQLLMT